MARRIIDQWNTKTLGGSGKLSPSDLNTVADAVHVEQSNIENMKLVNLVGQATNTQSQSGPIEVKHSLLEIDGANDDPTIFFQPDPYQIWQLNWGQWYGDGSSNLLYQGIDSTGARPSFNSAGVIFFSSATQGKFCTDNSAEVNGGARILVSYDTPLLAQTYNDTNGCDWLGFFTRLR